MSEAREGVVALSDNDLFYLRSILRNLDDLREISKREAPSYGVADEALFDNRDWLDCFIEKHSRTPPPPRQEPQRAEDERGTG